MGSTENDAKWLRKGPALHEIVSGITVIRRKGDCAIVLPVHNETELLNRHLEALSEQTTSDFDVIIVHSPELDVSAVNTKVPFGIAFIRLKSASAGVGYYAAQKYALRNGYSSIILADVDCLPVGRTAVQLLREAAATDKKTVFFPVIRSMAREARKNRSLHWYSAMDRSVLEKSGLTYLPLYYGRMDLELELRICTTGSGLRYMEEVSVDHPHSKNLDIGTTLGRTLYELRNSGQFIFVYPTIQWALPIYTIASLCFFDSYERFFYRLRLMLALFRAMLRLKLYKNPPFHSVTIAPYQKTSLEDAMSSGRKPYALILEEQLGDDRTQSLCRLFAAKKVPYSLIKGRSPLALLYFMWQPLRAVLASDTIVLCMHWKEAFNPALLLAPNIFLHDGANTWLLCQNRSIISRLCRFLVSTSSFFSLVAVYLLISIISCIRMGGASRRYGLADDCGCKICASHASS